MFKRFLSLLLAVIMMLSISGCSKTKDASSAKSEKQFFIITDHANNQVTIPTNIQKIVIDQVPLAATYCMFMGGKTDKLVGLSASVLDAVSTTALVKISPQILKVQTNFYENGELNMEELLKLKPDVVFYNAGNTKHAEMFKQAGIPAVGFNTAGGISSADPTQLYADWLRLLEKVFREEGKMDKVIAYGDETYKMVQNRIATVPRDKRPAGMILFNYEKGKIMVPGATGHFGGNWLKAIGVNNVAADITGMGKVTLEQVYKWNPEIIFMPGPGQCSLKPTDLANNKVEGEDWSPLTAVQNRKVYTCDLGMWSWYTPNPDAPLVLQWLGQKAYPDLFKDVNLVQETKKYYRNFYNYELSDEQLAYIFENGNIKE